MNCMGPFLLLGALAAAPTPDGYAIVVTSSNNGHSPQDLAELWTRVAGEVLVDAQGYPSLASFDGFEGWEAARILLAEQGTRSCGIDLCVKSYLAMFRRLGNLLTRIDIFTLQTAPMQCRIAACGD